MSLKSIEMQVALPRTHEAGKLSEQLQQRGHMVNEQAAEQLKKELELKRKGITKQEQKDPAKLHEEPFDKEQTHDESERKKKNKQKQASRQSHPYKGKSIDFNG